MSFHSFLEGTHSLPFVISRVQFGETDTMAGISDNELREIYDFAVQLGKDAGALLMSAARSRFNGGDSQVFTEKDNSVDLVTKTDTGS